MRVSDQNNIADYFLHRQVRRGLGDVVAIIHDSSEQGSGSKVSQVTYRELQRLTCQVGNGLKAKGIKPGERVVITLPDGPEFAAALFGICQIGAVAVMINTTKKPAEVQGLAAEAGAKLVIGGPSLDFVTAFKTLVSGQSDELDVTPVRKRADALWLYSGGSTGGKQKIVRQGHNSYIEVTKYLAQKYLGYSPSDRTLSIARLFFGYATGGNLFFPLSVGGTAILCSAWPTPQGIFEQAKTHRPTILINTPKMIIAMLDWAEQHPGECDLSSVRFMTSAGEALPPAAYERWKRLFPNVPLIDGLGFAEHWYFVSVDTPESIVPGTVGRIIPPMQVRVCDEAGNEVSEGQEGWLWVKGSAMANGYYNNPDATQAAFRLSPTDGGQWFVSGDLVKIVKDTPDGHPRLIYVDRADDSFKVSGQWVAAKEVSDCLGEHPAVVECAVTKYKDPETGLSKPAAFVLLKDGHHPAEEELKGHIREKLAPHKCPQKFVFLTGPLPRTPLGKVDRKVLRDLVVQAA